MGQKVHPYGIRLGINKDWVSEWMAKSKKDFARNIHSDHVIREEIQAKLGKSAISSIVIERRSQTNTKVIVYCARPGVIIGKRGGDLEKVQKLLLKKTGVKKLQISVKEVKKPEIISKLVAESVAQQLERRMPFRRVLKRTIQNTMRAGAQGVKIAVSGRLAGAEIARREWQIEGRVPLHTFRADIDYGTALASTTYGVIGVKVWIYKGEKQFAADKYDKAEVVPPQDKDKK